MKFFFNVVTTFSRMSVNNTNRVNLLQVQVPLARPHCQRETADAGSCRWGCIDPQQSRDYTLSPVRDHQDLCYG